MHYAIAIGNMEAGLNTAVIYACWQKLFLWPEDKNMRKNNLYVQSGKLFLSSHNKKTILIL